MKNIDILYEDAECMVLHKPAGLAVQGGVGVRNSLDSLLGELRNPKPLLVHRLDKDTSGAILVAKSKEAASRYAALFSGGGIDKEYLAVCSGGASEKNGAIRDPIFLHGRMKASITRYEVLAYSSSNSLLRLNLETGRMHQIRRHLAGMKLPILGDDKYGDFPLNKRLRKEQGLKRLLLHAFKLTIAPSESKPLTIIAPLPSYFLEFLQEFPIDLDTLSCL